MTQPHEVLYASQQYQEWLAELKARAMLQTHNQAQAMFRAVLVALRRHMTTAEVLEFADALPPLPRGIFLERWRPAEAAPLASADALLSEVVRDLAAHHAPPESIVGDVFAVLAAHAGHHAAAIMRRQLPPALLALWPNQSEHG